MSASGRDRRVKVYAYGDAGSNGIVKPAYTLLHERWASRGTPSGREAMVAGDASHRVDAVFGFDDHVTVPVDGLLLDGTEQFLVRAVLERRQLRELRVLAERHDGADLPVIDVASIAAIPDLRNYWDTALAGAGAWQDPVSGEHLSFGAGAAAPTVESGWLAFAGAQECTRAGTAPADEATLITVIKPDAASVAAGTASIRSLWGGIGPSAGALSQWYLGIFPNTKVRYGIVVGDVSFATGATPDLVGGSLRTLTYRTYLLASGLRRIDFLVNGHLRISAETDPGTWTPEATETLRVGHHPIGTPIPPFYYIGRIGDTLRIERPGGVPDAEVRAIHNLLRAAKPEYAALAEAVA